MRKLIGWTGNKFKFDAHYLAKGGFWLGVGQILTTIAGLLTSVAFANMLPQYEYGVYKYILSIAELTAAFSLSGLLPATTKAIAQGSLSALERSVRSHLRWNLLAISIGSALSLYYFIQSDFLIARTLFVASILIPLVATGGLFYAYYEGIKEYRWRTFFLGLHMLLPVGALMAILRYTDDIFLIALMYLGAQVLVTWSILLLTRRWIRAHEKTVPAKDIDPVRFGAHMSIMNSIGTIAGKIENVLVFQMLGPAHLAVYIFAIALPSQLSFFQKGMKTLALPRFSERSFEMVRQSLPKKAALLTLAAAGIVIVYIVLAPFVYRTFFPAYEDAIFISQLFALTYLLIPFSVVGEALTAHGYKKELYVGTVASLVVRLGTLALFIPLWGLYGVIISLALSRLTTSFFHAYYLSYPKPHHDSH